MGILKFYLDGTVSYGHIKKTELPPAYTRIRHPDESFWLMAVQVHGIVAALAAVAALGLSTLSNSQKTTKPRRGLNGITPHGKRLVKGTAAWLERERGRATLSFCTLTLPSEYAIAPIGKHEGTKQGWTELTRQYIQKIQYHLGKYGLPKDVVGVTEIQERRMERYGGMPLHLHIVFQGRKPKGAWAMTCEQLSELWRDTVENVMGIKEGTNWEAAVNVQRVKKSVAGYLGKYLSKGTKVIEKVIQEEKQDLLPSTWYVCTSGLRAIYKKNLYVLSGSTAGMGLDILTGVGRGLIGWSRDIVIKGADGYPWKAGWVGKLVTGITNAGAFEAMLALF